MSMHSQPARSRFSQLQALAGAALLLGVFLAPALPASADEPFPGDIIMSDDVPDSGVMTAPADDTGFDLDLAGPSDADDAYDVPEDGLLETPAPGDLPSYVDSDGDTIADATETSLGSNPDNFDTDGDTASDGVEYFEIGTSLFNPDTDGDGFSDGDEYWGWCPTAARFVLPSDPLNPSSIPYPCQ